MILAKYVEKKTAVEIITNAFDTNPSVNIVIGDHGNRKKKIGRLAAYAFVKSMNRNGAFFSENKMGTALCFHSKKGSPNMNEIWHEMRFACSIPIKKVIQTLKREAYIKKFRFKGEHYYFWFLAVNNGAGKAAFEMKDYLFDLSKKEALPILLETSVERNKLIYERYGFRTYHEWPNSGNGKTLWFMIREV
ncbi:MAG: hypothetical protein ACI857_002905 [Arenicella sp.]|jgi:hypothetical protein